MTLRKFWSVIVDLLPALEILSLLILLLAKEK